MTDTSVSIIDDFFGEPVTRAHVERLSDWPEDQLIDLARRLNDGWNAWFAGRFDQGLSPDTHYFLGETRSEIEPLPLPKYMQLALYFPSIAAPDPVEATVGTHLQLAQITGSILPDQLRSDLAQGLERLMQIAPLVRAGALSLVPSLQAGVSHGVQSLAQRELGATALATGRSRQELSEAQDAAFACATGICSMAAYWPVASTAELWRRLREGGMRIAREASAHNLPVEEAVTELEVPSVTKVPIDDLLRLRANEAAFSDFREAFGVAIREARDQGHTHGPHFAYQVFRDRLMPHQARCTAVATRTNAFDGVMLPGGAALAAGGLAWMLGATDDPTQGFEHLSQLLINTVAPGAAWIAMSAGLRAAQPINPALAVYSALLDKA